MHTHIYVHICSNLGSRLFWIKIQHPSVQCPALHSPSTMAGRMAGSNGMSSDESEDKVKEATAASQSTSGMASVAAGSSSPQEPGRVYKDAGSGLQTATSCGIVLAGTAWSIPGRTKEEGAFVAMEALRYATEGRQVLHPSGQQREWLHRRFIASELGVGVGQ